MPVELKCLECGTAFSVKPSRRKKAKYCSDSCRIKNNSRGAGAANPNWKGGDVSLNCKVCGKLFTAKRSVALTRKYCSRDCKSKSGSQAGENNPSWKGGPIKKICERCEKIFYVGRTREKSAKYCSHTCSSRSSEKPLRVKNAVRIKNCAQCGKTMDWYTEFRRLPISTFESMKFCSRSCADEGGFRYRGKQHPRFKPDSRRKDRRGSQNSWRKKVFQRDNYSCQMCGAHGLDDGVYLVAHHLVEFAVDKEKRWDIDNGQTLCVVCHGVVHGYEGYDEISEDEIIVKVTPTSVGRRVEVECSWCGKKLYKAPSDLIHYPSKKRKKYAFCNKEVCMRAFNSEERKGKSIAGTRVTIDGTEFKSYGAVSRKYGVEVSTYWDRVHRQGLTPEQAVGIDPKPMKSIRRNRIVIDSVNYPSVKAACLDRSLRYGLVQSRLRAGWTNEQAFEIDDPPVQRHSGKQVTVDKVKYPSIRAAAEAYGMSIYVVRRRIGLGWTVKRALKTPVR